MHKETLSGEQVRAIIDSVGEGQSYTKRLENVAARIGTTRKTLFIYQSVGALNRTINVALYNLAAQHGVDVVVDPRSPFLV